MNLEPNLEPPTSNNLLSSHPNPEPRTHEPRTRERPPPETLYEVISVDAGSLGRACAAAFLPDHSSICRKRCVSCSREQLHHARSSQLEGGRGLYRRRRQRALRGGALGQGLLLDHRDRPRARPPDEGSGALDRPEAARRSPAAPRHRAAGPDPLQRHPPAPRRRDPRRLSHGHHPARVQGPLHLRLPDQGEPAAAGRRGGARLRQAVRLRPRGRLQAGAAGRGGA